MRAPGLTPRGGGAGRGQHPQSTTPYWPPHQRCALHPPLSPDLTWLKPGGASRGESGGQSPDESL